MPLQTLSGWPTSPDPSPLVVLGLLVGLPVVVIVLAFAVAKAGNMAKVSRTGGGVQVTDPVWMGGRAKSIMSGPEYELTEVAEPQRESLEAGEGDDGESVSSASGAESGTGGAGARW